MGHGVQTCSDKRSDDGCRKAVSPEACRDDCWAELAMLSKLAAICLVLCSQVLVSSFCESLSAILVDPRPMLMQHSLRHILA